jgi:hypothetical protein
LAEAQRLIPAAPRHEPLPPRGSSTSKILGKGNLARTLPDLDKEAAMIARMERRRFSGWWMAAAFVLGTASGA